MSKKTWIALLLALSIPMTSYSETTCDQVLREAGKVITAQKAQIEVRDRELTQTDLILNSQASQIKDLQHPGLLASPYLWLVVGLVVGGYVARH